MTVPVFISPKSGNVRDYGAEALADLIVSQLHDAGHEGRAHIAETPDLMDHCRRDLEADPHTPFCVVAGGDGTIAAISSLIAGTHTALLPTPGGTMNLFCRDLGFSNALSGAVPAALGGAPRPVDLGLIGDRAFVNNVVFGIYADIAEARERFRDARDLEENLGALSEAAEAALTAEPAPFRIATEASPFDLVTNTLIVTNNPYTDSNALTPSRDRLDSGVLGVYAPGSETTLDFLDVMLEFMRGARPDSPAYRYFETQRCQIGSDEPTISLAIDGDPVSLSPPINLSIRPRALQVLAPAPHDGRAS